MSSWIPTTPLAKAVDLAGFSYDPGQDIIFSKMNPLQRSFGYAYGYDANALLMGANIDSEPIFFDYAGKHWMIELWKGQYGLETGAEIGIYTRPLEVPFYVALLDATLGKRDDDPAPSHSLFYQCASDADMLTMSFTLLRDGEPLFTRGPEPHWWLTGFKWGVYSDPADLVLLLEIHMPDPGMLRAFTDALQVMGHQFRVDSGTVALDFTTPVTHQPRRTSPLRPGVETADRDIVAAYQAFGLATNDPNQVGPVVADRVEGMVLGKSADFLGQLFATAFKEAGKSADEVARILTTELGTAAAAVQGWVTDAGYELRDWIESVYTALQQTFTLNYSCAVEIDNLTYGGRLATELRRTDFGVRERSFLHLVCGHYLVEPPECIRANTRARFYLKDNWGAEGAEGWATYAYVDESGREQSVQFRFGCPTGTDDNYASAQTSPFGVHARVGSSAAWHDTVPPKDHPLSVAFVFNHGPVPS